MALPCERLTLATEVEADALREFVAQTRAQGHARTRNTVEDGVASVAMAFFLGSLVDPAGTISIAVPDVSLTAARAAEVSNSRSIRGRPRIVGGRHREHLAPPRKVVCVSAGVIGSPPSSAVAGYWVR